MVQLNRPLTVFLYHGCGNPLAVRALRSRLVDDGVDVRSLDGEESSSPDATPEYENQLRENALRDAVRESDVLLICLSTESIQVERSNEIQLVSAMMVEKTQGALFVMPVRFEKCDVPDSLKRWQAVDLFDETGYERLMQALKLRADRLGAVLELRKEWSIPFQWNEEDDEEDSASQKSNFSLLTLGATVLVVAFLMFWALPGIFKAVTQTQVPVEVLVENSTQNAREQENNRSMTQTAVIQTVRAPLTQTAAAEGTLQNPATPTLQFPTIIALPTEIIDPGNIRMVYVPGDNFVIGNKNDTTGVNPIHTIYVEPFYIDKYEVTNVLYHLCVEAGACEPPKSVNSQTRPVYYGSVEFNEYPVVNVTWLMAKQYCEWRGARLPSEAEWEKTARSTDGRSFPWGEDSGCTYANYTDAGGSCVGDTTAVGTYGNGRSLYGAFDLSGNVSEWVNSLYWTYPYSSEDGR